MKVIERTQRTRKRKGGTHQKKDVTNGRKTRKFEGNHRSGTIGQ